MSKPWLILTDEGRRRWGLGDETLCSVVGDACDEPARWVMWLECDARQTMQRPVFACDEHKREFERLRTAPLILWAIFRNDQTGERRVVQFQTEARHYAEHSARAALVSELGQEEPTDAWALSSIEGRRP